MRIRQGEIYLVRDSPWIVVDHFHNNNDRYSQIHYCPLLNTTEVRLDLDVQVSFEERFASLGLMRRLRKADLGPSVAAASTAELNELRKNLVTWFSVYSFSFDTVRRLPAPPDEPLLIYPGMIFDRPSGRICVVDHWGSFNDYPLLYVAPVTPEVVDPCPLDVEISAEYRDLFSDRYFVKTDELFQVRSDELKAVRGFPIPMLAFGFLRKITHVLILKFGDLGLLL